MQVVNKIDLLIAELTKLRPTLSDDPSSNEKRFSDLLTSSLADNHTLTDEAIENAKIDTGIPSWVDPDYSYDPQNPRKPNMRELMEAMSGKKVKDLYAEIDKDWQKISHRASEVLYGAVGPNEDSRDWLSIMTSDNILKTAREQTGLMHKPEVDIQSNFTDGGVLIEQMAVLKDNKGNTLRLLSNDISSTEETLLNFGATKDSIPTNLEEKIDPEKFDNDLLTFLKNFDNNTTSVQQIVIQSASEAIANKISQEIPLDELAKL